MDEIIYKFECAMSQMAAGLIDTSGIEENVLLDDRAIVRYRLQRPRTIGEVIDIINDTQRMVMLYNYVQRGDTQLGRSCCFYSDNKRGQLFRLDFYTEHDGLCHIVTATFFTSVEYMYQDIIHEHSRIQLHGRMEYLRSRKKVMADFM